MYIKKHRKLMKLTSYMFAQLKSLITFSIAQA